MTRAGAVVCVAAALAVGAGWMLVPRGDPSPGIDTSSRDDGESPVPPTLARAPGPDAAEDVAPSAADEEPRNHLTAAPPAAAPPAVDEVQVSVRARFRGTNTIPAWATLSLSWFAPRSAGTAHRSGATSVTIEGQVATLRVPRGAELRGVVVTPIEGYDVWFLKASKPLGRVRADADTWIDVEVDEGGSIDGTVVDEVTGAPLTGASILSGPVPEVSTTSASTGVFRLAGVHPDSGTRERPADVRVEHRDYVGRTFSVVFPEGERRRTGLRLRLRRGVTLRGRLVGPDGSGLASAFVALLGAEGSERVSLARSITHDGGRFSFRGVEPGTASAIGAAAHSDSRGSDFGGRVVEDPDLSRDRDDLLIAVGRGVELEVIPRAGDQDVRTGTFDIAYETETGFFRLSSGSPNPWFSATAGRPCRVAVHGRRPGVLGRMECFAAVADVRASASDAAAAEEEDGTVRAYVDGRWAECSPLVKSNSVHRVRVQAMGSDGVPLEWAWARTDGYYATSGIAWGKDHVSIDLPMGTCQVWVHAPGHRPRRLRIDVLAPGESERRVVLERLEPE